MIKACIFDCDGTLLDTLTSISYCANRALADFGFPVFDSRAYKYFVGDGAANLVRRCLKAAGDTKCSHFDEVLKRYKEYFAVDCMYEVRPYEGINELTEQLKKQGIAFAVLSNKPHEQTVKVISDTFPENTFAAVQGQMEGIPIKPAPDGALFLAKKMGALPEECLYIGDTDTDMKTGNAAGMHTVGVLWGFRERKELEENRAEFIAGCPEEILQIISENFR
ncbi:MAG: HAD family hydrolase [Eubacteriales bacterium]|nr:HAD family hydrolase [Eubacteriales bacterium]